MKTVQVAAIKASISEPEFADYFIESLEHIFIMNSEYPSYAKEVILTWSIFISGHGMINRAIAGLSLEQFKRFLTFLDEKLKVRLVVYDSCYVAGLNAETIYKDAQKGVDKTYSFAIITNALTDVITFGSLIKLQVKKSKLRIKASLRFRKFFEISTFLDSIDYRALVAALIPHFSTSKTLPQIKFPGLE